MPDQCIHQFCGAETDYVCGGQAGFFFYSLYLVKRLLLGEVVCQEGDADDLAVVSGVKPVYGVLVDFKHAFQGGEWATVIAFYPGGPGFVAEDERVGQSAMDKAERYG